MSATTPGGAGHLEQNDADVVHSGQILGCQGLVAVDGTAYNWMGAAAGPANVEQVSAEYTSTKSIFTFNVADKVTLTATFLSPVYPDDLVKQSQQFAYVSLLAKSSDGAPHSVQAYMDVSGGEYSPGPGEVGFVFSKCVSGN